MEETKDQILYYRPKSNRPFNIVLIIFILCFLGSMITGTNDVYHLSSFINGPDDFLLPLNIWGIECLPCSAKPYTIAYYVFETILPFLLGLLLLSAFKAILQSEVKENSRIFSFSLPNLKEAGVQRFVLLLLVIAIIFNTVGNYISIKELGFGPCENDIDPSSLQNASDIYYVIYNTKNLFYLIPTCFIVGGFLYNLVNDFGSLWKKYVGYFYTNIIATGILICLFMFFNQAFDFIVALADPIDLILFSILFGFSLLGFWLIPYYLYYTRKLKKFRELSSTKEILRYTWYPVNVDKLVFVSDAHLSRYNEFIESNESAFFHKLRRAFAILFIFTFLIIQINLLSASCSKSIFTIGPWMLLNLLGIVWINLKFRKARREDIERLKLSENTYNIHSEESGKTYLNYNSSLSRLSVKLYSIIGLNIIVLAGHLAFLYFYPEASIVYKLIWFVAHTFLFSWSFLIYVLYRKMSFIKNDYNFKNKFLQIFFRPIIKFIHGLVTDFGFTPLLMQMFYAISGISFVILLGILITHSPLIEKLNPVILILIVLNFSLSLLAILDRYIFCILQSDKIHQRNKLTIGLSMVSIVILLVMINGKENGYHDLVPREFTPESLPEVSNYKNLEAYTENFLKDKDTTETIYFIAADGGGLKAAFWTMNILHELDKRSVKQGYTEGSFFTNTFMTSGASGGMVGLGMYTHLHGQNLSLSEKKQLIDTLGKTNFLSNDIAGVTVKVPALKVFPFLNGFMEDRMKAMSRRYFQLTSESGNLYENITEGPFAHLWLKRNYDDLPLLIVNTTKTKDGSRGIIHPLSPAGNEGLLSAFTDLSDYDTSGGLVNEVNTLSYSDGLFTTNRFPIFSPTARVEGKGHFVDGGYLENSGLSTILHFLNYMKLSSNPVYEKLFKMNIVVVSIGNDRKSYIKHKFRGSKINKIFSQNEVSSILGAISGGGLSALPDYYDHIFERLKGSTNPDRLPIKDFVQIDMPFPVSVNDINSTFNGQVNSCETREKVKEVNKGIAEAVDTAYYNSICSSCKFIFTPPLGRFISTPAGDYMKSMVRHPDVQGKMDRVQ